MFSQKEVESDFIYEKDFFLLTSTSFVNGDSLFYGNIERFINNNCQSRIELDVKFGEFISYYFIFIDARRLRVVQKKRYDFVSNDIIDNVIFYPINGRLKGVNFDGSSLDRKVEEVSRVAMIIDFIEAEIDVVIKY